MEQGFNVKVLPEERGQFRLSSGFLPVGKSLGEYANITKSNSEFLAKSTMHTRLGALLARRLLGIETPSSVKSRSRILLKDLEEMEMEELSPQRLKEVIKEVINSVGTNTDLNMREFLGINKALTRIQGELANNAGKLTEINAHITREQAKLDKIETSPDLQVHEKRVKAKNCRAERRKGCEIRAVVTESQRVGFPVCSHSPNLRENPRWGSESSRQTQGRVQRTQAQDHCCADITGLDHLNDKDSSSRWWW